MSEGLKDKKATNGQMAYPLDINDKRVRKRLERLKKRNPQKAARFEELIAAWPLQNPLLATTRPGGGLAGALAAGSARKGGGSDAAQSKGRSSVFTVLCSVACNLAVGAVDFVAAGISGSSAMFVEGIHSVVDSGNGLLVLLGIKRSYKQPDAVHPFGYGKELYFWTMMVSLVVFLFGGAFSLFEGVRSIAEIQAGTASELGDVTLNYIVLGASLVIEATSLTVALKAFNKARGATSPLAFIRQASDPSLYTVVLEDTASEMGLIGALASTVLCQITGNLYFDAAASLFIGALLCTVAFTLLAQTKRLLIGAGMDAAEVLELRALIEGNCAVRSCENVRTLYMGPSEIVVAAAVSWCDDLSESEVRAASAQVSSKVQERWPAMGALLLEAGA